MIIPTYNGALLLEEHIPAVIDAMRNDDELLIIDDASTDETSDWIGHHFKLIKCTSYSEYIVCSGKHEIQGKNIDVHYIKNKHNIRFALNCNRAVRHAEHPLIFLLNSDVTPELDTITNLCAYFDHNPDVNVFGVGCKEFEDKKCTVVSGKNKLWFQRGMFMHSKADNFKSGPTAWVSGGSGMFDRKKWLQLDGFSPAYYPAYWEDIDLSYRARQRGWQVLFASDAVVHHQHETTNSTTFGNAIDAISWKNAQTFVLHHATIFQLAQYLFFLPYWWWKRLSAPATPPPTTL